jgi:hypothetical protein
MVKPYREGSMSTKRTFVAPRGEATEGRLELTRGGIHTTVRTGKLDELCRAEFEGVTPKVTAADGTVAVAYPRFSAAGLLRHPAHRAEIELTEALPWSIVFAGGVGESSADLRGVELRDFQTAGGVADVRVLLPRPRGVVRVRVGGGATKLMLRRPAGVAAVLRIAGGATRLAFDGERFGAIGGETRLETPDAGSSPDRYEFEILGGASEVTVDESDAGAP